MVKEDTRAWEGISGNECLLASKDADGSVRLIGPFSRERAEALVQVYGRMYPSQACWIEPLPHEVQDLHLGRVSRLPRPTVGPPSDSGH